MSRLGFNTVVYDGELHLGELEAIPTKDQNFQFPNNEIRIHHLSQQNERGPPLSILQTISSFSVRCKLESTLPVEQPHLINLHACCFYEFKTAVVLVGDEEIHLVAMPSKQKKYPCFWCYAVPLGLYSACLGMLNMRCLSIVFDLDETLIVANTMKSFDNRIEALRSWIAREVDEVRIAGMSAEMKRYEEDRSLLKQYIDNDSLVDNAKVFKAQLEEVPPLSHDHQKIVRPIIRIPEKNIVLTRINPEIHDTSVLVRLRPAWEDLRNYLTAKGRKRFEVYVCTMAERGYALEMWRLLDPEAHLIASKQLRDRVVCVKSDSQKSLLNVFQHGVCHPKMAMVVDDRSKVWTDLDQPRVHVVPAFTPYYAPQAETASAVPILCVARNVACNVRGSFFRDFDEFLLRKISEVFYEDDIVNLPPAPDVSNYLMSKDTGPAVIGNMNAPIREGINSGEVDQRLNQANDKGGMESAAHSMKNHAEVRSQNSQATVANFHHVVGAASLTPVIPFKKPGLGPHVQRDSFSDLDYDIKRGLIDANSALDGGQNSAEPLVQSRVPAQTPSGWLVDDVQQPDGLKPEMQNPLTPFTPGSTPTCLLAHKSDLKREEVCSGRDLQKQNPSLPSQLAELQSEHGQAAAAKRKVVQRKAAKERVVRTSGMPAEPVEAATPVRVEAQVESPIGADKKKMKKDKDKVDKDQAEKLLYVSDNDPVDLEDDLPPPPSRKKQKKRKRVEEEAEKNKEARTKVFGADPLFGRLVGFDFAHMENAIMALEDPFNRQFEIPHSKVPTIDWVKDVPLAMHRKTIPFVNRIVSGSQRKLEEFFPGPSRNHVAPSELVELLAYVVSEVDYHMQRALNMYSHAYHSKKANMAEQAKVETLLKVQEKVLQERDSAFRELEKMEKLEKLRKEAEELKKAVSEAKKASDVAQQKRQEADLKVMDAEAKLQSLVSGSGGSGATEIPIGIYKFWLRRHHINLNVNLDFVFEHAIGGPWRMQKPTPPAESSGEEEEG